MAALWSTVTVRRGVVRRHPNVRYKTPSPPVTSASVRITPTTPILYALRSVPLPHSKFSLFCHFFFCFPLAFVVRERNNRCTAASSPEKHTAWTQNGRRHKRILRGNFYNHRTLYSVYFVLFYCISAQRRRKRNARYYRFYSRLRKFEKNKILNRVLRVARYVLVRRS